MMEYEKMKKGMIYDALTEKIGTEAKNTHRLCEKYNKLGADDGKRKNKLLKKLFPNDDFGLFRTMETPIFIDNISGFNLAPLQSWHGRSVIYIS